MRVAELMQPKVKTVGSDAAVAEAIVSLADAHISGMPVVDGAGKVIGIVSATDLLTAEAEAGDPTARQALFDNTPVRDIMTPRPYTIGPDEDIREAARSGDADRGFAALGQIVLEHNGWCDEDGVPYPPPGERAFWDAIPTELASVVIVLVQREAQRLPNSLGARS